MAKCGFEDTFNGIPLVCNLEEHDGEVHQTENGYIWGAPEAIKNNIKEEDFNGELS